MANPILTLARQYVTALRDEPKLRAFAAASFVDDIGVAVATWASTLLLTNLFTSQRARGEPGAGRRSSRFLALGTIVSGPIADWAGRVSLARLARWRWRVVVWARVTEAAFVGVLSCSASPRARRRSPASCPSRSWLLFRRPRSCRRGVHSRWTCSVARRLQSRRPRTAARGRTRRAARVQDPPPRDDVAHRRAQRGGDTRRPPRRRPLARALRRTLRADVRRPGADAPRLRGGHRLLLSPEPRPARESASSTSSPSGGQGLDDDGAAATSGPSPASRPLRAQERSVTSSGRSPRGRAFSPRSQTAAAPHVLLTAGAAIVEWVTESYNGKMIVKQVLHGSGTTRLRYAELRLERRRRHRRRGGPCPRPKRRQHRQDLPP